MTEEQTGYMTGDGEWIDPWTVFDTDPSGSGSELAPKDRPS